MPAPVPGAASPQAAAWHAAGAAGVPAGPACRVHVMAVSGAALREARGAVGRLLAGRRRYCPAGRRQRSRGRGCGCYTHGGAGEPAGGPPCGPGGKASVPPAGHWHAGAPVHSGPGGGCSAGGRPRVAVLVPGGGRR